MKKILFSSIGFLLIFSACQTGQNRIGYENRGEIFGLAGPVQLEKDTSVLYMEDYFVDVSKIDSLAEPDHFEMLFSEDHKIVKLIPEGELPAIINLKIWIEGVPYSIPLEKSRKEWVTISFDPGEESYQSIQIAGEMNGWNPSNTNLTKEDGVWKKKLLLNPGRYQYLLVLDGEWVTDPSNPDSISNNQGKYNSVLTVGDMNEEKAPLLYTAEILDEKIQLGVNNNADAFFIYWQNLRLPEDMYRLDNGSLSIQIPAQAADYERSYIRAWAVNEQGVSNDILVPLDNGKVITEAEQLNRHDEHAMILYNVFVDRFYNADPTNDKPLNIPEVLPPADYHGGDIKGIIEKIEDGYFRDLGVNTIWVSPLVLNPEGPYGKWPDPATKYSGYHGYWPISFTQVDYRFGTEEDLHRLVEIAHENNMNVLLDFVANHVHELHPVYQEHPEWATDLYLPDGRTNTQLWDEQRLTTWFDTFLPTLDLSKPQVVEMLTDSAVYWIKEYNLDGFRHDATKHIPLVFWRTLTRKLKEEVMFPQDKMLYQIGETYGSSELIGSYVSLGKLDAQFDFNVYDDAIAVFAKDDQGFDRLNRRLEESLHYYGDHNLMGYITGNQDRPRFISLAGGDLSFDEDAKQAGWDRDIGVGDPVGYRKLTELTAFLMTIPGVPVIFYGDEIGMPGGNDPDNRRMMRFSGLSEKEEWVKAQVKKLIDIRMNNLELIYGDFEPLIIEKDVYVYMRTYFDQVSVVVFNNSKQEKRISFELPERFAESSLSSRFGNDTEQIGYAVKLDLLPHSYDVLTN
mgnify:CR=1 FL=1